MKITAIKQQIKNPERASIFVDGKYSFSLSLNELVAEKLKNGQELDESELVRLKKLSSEGKLKMRALAWVLMRPHSQKEFADYLKRKKAPPELVEVWNEEFSAKNYLDDQAFARWWVETRRTSKLSSTKKLTYELRQKGVSRQAIDQALSLENPEDELQALRSLAAKKLKLSRYQQDPEKLKRYLLAQGYSYGLISRVLLDED